MFFLFLRNYIINQLDKTLITEYKNLYSSINQVNRIINNPVSFINTKFNTFKKYNITIPINKIKNIYYNFYKFYNNPQLWLTEYKNKFIANIRNNTASFFAIKQLLLDRNIAQEWVFLNESRALVKLSYNKKTSYVFLEFKKTPGKIYVYYLSFKNWDKWEQKGLTGTNMWAIWFRSQLIIKDRGKLDYFSRHNTYAKSPILLNVIKKKEMKQLLNNKLDTSSISYKTTQIYKKIAYHKRIRQYSLNKQTFMINLLFNKINKL